MVTAKEEIPFESSNGSWCNDEIYFKSFESTMEEIRKVYEPQVVVCVVDPSVLGGDIHGDFNLTSRGLVKCMLKDLVFNRNKVPCLLLGGTHGSFSSEAAKLWAYCPFYDRCKTKNK